MTELGDRLGPLLWQFAPTKKFDEADFGAFLELLPAKPDGLQLRHVVEVRHDSFLVPAFIALLREFTIAGGVRRARDLSGDRRRHRRLRLSRLQKGKDTIATGYPPKELDAWAKRARDLGRGGVPKDLPQVDAEEHAEGSSRATCSSTSSTRARCARRPPRWR